MATARAMHHYFFIIATASFLPAAAHGGHDPNDVPAGDHEDFKLGESSKCDGAWKPVTNSWACRAAMSRVDGRTRGDQDGETYLGKEKEKDWPRGCYFCRGVKGCKDGTHFNEHATGSYAKGARPYCMRWNYLQTGEVLFVGDSDVDQWKKTSELVPGSYNVGRGGYTCANVFKRVKSMSNTFKPSVVVLVCGENDLAAGTSTRKTYKRFLKITKAFNDAGAHVVYLGTKPEPDTKKLHEKYRRYDEYIKQLVHSRHHSHDSYDHAYDHYDHHDHDHRRRRGDVPQVHSYDHDHSAHSDHHDHDHVHPRRLTHDHDHDDHDHHGHFFDRRRRRQVYVNDPHDHHDDHDHDDHHDDHDHDDHDHHGHGFDRRRRRQVYVNDPHDHHDHPDRDGPFYGNHNHDHDHDDHHDSRGSITMIDVHKSFQARGNPDKLYANDGLHLSSDGYHLWSHWTKFALNDPTCALWVSGNCESRRATSPTRRATMVIGSSDGTANATSNPSQGIMV